MEALISTIWLDEWGDSEVDYIGVLLTCPLPNLAGIGPKKVYVGPISCHENPSHSIEISSLSNEPIPSNPESFALCIKGLDFDEDISEKLVAFIELNRILGAGVFNFYVFNVHERVLKVLRLYEASKFVKWYNLTLPGELPNQKSARRRIFEKNIWMKRRMELIPYNHCFYENLYSAEYVVPIDIDETIVPVKRKNWYQLMLDERRRLGRTFKEYASYAARNVYFFTEMQNVSRRLPNGTAGSEYLSTVRTAVVSPEGDSVKSFVSTKRALTVHNHYALAALNPANRRTHHFDPEDVLKHHHRACDERHLDCDALMEEVRMDRSALRYEKELKARIKIAMTNLESFAG